MKFPYKFYGKDTLRPVIPIEIRSGSEAVRYEVLVDSGADINLVPSEIGELIGLDVTSGEEHRVGGITGGGLPYFLHPVTIRVGGWSYHVEMGFMPGMPSMGYVVVGQRGFFDLFQSVSFDVHGEEIEIRML
jgi:hypothetical protein